MLGKILKLFVGDKSKKDLKLINPIIEKIHSFEQEMNGLSNDELRDQTLIFKKEIHNATSDINLEIERIKNEINDINDFDKKEELFNKIDKLNEDAYKVSEETLSTSPAGGPCVLFIKISTELALKKSLIIFLYFFVLL